ncbi:nucleotidyl transferase AbiEii/AbiGii toxin family protein [Hymenobacter puniceus]|uniref:nucleotidyl transferase AbiEii/AbiGii toxin family protein n=1 Tax=Hymenobacter sp. BT190 TaxID=2763505 RepID=UPI0016517068|nr:nucleotidyl transferase AbiEii/AbiGii toxin family protein [Hymenobacter sp. BT190]MBC6696794.1 nucleotidyl transferase AbiEii/AbiGii toxin family protein [Hymenobacter sp. BT190]
MEYTHIIALRAVALAFGDLLPQVVFVGGVTVGLYATNPVVPDPRPTDDVDCIIDLASYAQFTDLEEKLRQRGFRHDRESGIQIRWCWQNPGSLEEYVVDIMPADGGTVLGSTVNRWYPSGMASSVRYQLPLGDIEIQLLDAPHFIATKLEAMYARATDKRWSQDWEDIIYVLETRRELLDEVARAPDDL